MIRHTLFPYDWSEQCRQTVPYVRALAQRLGARVTLFGVSPPTFSSVSAAGRRHLHVGIGMDEWRCHLQAELDRVFVDEFAGIAMERIADGGDPAIRAGAVFGRHAPCVRHRQKEQP